MILGRVDITFCTVVKVMMTMTFQIFRDYLTFAGIGLTNAQVFELSVGEFKQNKVH